jgi:hypothetical protein
LSIPKPESLRRFGRLVVEHQSLAVSLGYVALVLIGMFHMALYYLHFRVNVLMYAQPADFLLSPLADPFVIVASILPYFAFGLLQRADRWFGDFVRRKRGKVRTPEQAARDDRLYRQIQLIGTVLWIVALGLTVARMRAERIQDGHALRQRVELTNGQRLGSAGDSTVALIGTTTSYAFFYEGRRDSSTGAPNVVIVPVENVARMDHPPRVRRRR